MPTSLTGTREALVEEVSWLSEILQELANTATAQQTLPNCMVYHREVADRMRYFVAVVRGTLEDSQRTFELKGPSNDGCALLQELLLDATPNPYYTSAPQVVTATISALLARMKNSRPRLRDALADNKALQQATERGSRADSVHDKNMSNHVADAAWAEYNIGTTTPNPRKALGPEFESKLLSTPSRRAPLDFTSHSVSRTISLEDQAAKSKLLIATAAALQCSTEQVIAVTHPASTGAAPSPNSSAYVSTLRETVRESLAATALLSEALIFLRDIMLLTKECGANRSADSSNHHHQLVKSLGAAVSQAGLIEVLSDIIADSNLLSNAVAELVFKNGEARLVDLVEGEVPSSAFVVVNLTLTKEALRTLAAEALSLTISALGTTSSGRAYVLSHLYPAQTLCKGSLDQISHGQPQLYSAELEGNSLVQQQVLSVLESLVSIDTEFFVSLSSGAFPATLSNIVSNGGGAPNTHSSIGTTTTPSEPLPVLVAKLLRSTFKQNDHRTSSLSLIADEFRRQRQSRGEGSVRGRASQLIAYLNGHSAAVSILKDMIAAASRPSGRTSGQGPQAAFWSLLMSDVDEMAKTILLSVHFANKMLTQISSARLTLPEHTHGLEVFDEASQAAHRVLEASLGLFNAAATYYSLLSATQSARVATAAFSGGRHATNDASQLGVSPINASSNLGGYMNTPIRSRNGGDLSRPHAPSPAIFFQPSHQSTQRMRNVSANGNTSAADPALMGQVASPERFLRRLSELLFHEHLVVCLGRRPVVERGAGYSAESSVSRYFTMGDNLPLAIKVSKALKYLAEHCPPTANGIPSALVQCDEVLAVLLGALEPLSHLQGANIARHISQVEDEVSARQDNAMFALLQAEIASTLCISLLRSPANRHAFTQFIKRRSPLFGEDEGLLIISHHATQTLSHCRGSGGDAAVTEELVAWIRTALKPVAGVDNALPSSSTTRYLSGMDPNSFFGGLLIQDDRGSCLNDPFNFPEGWTQDETIAHTVHRPSELIVHTAQIPLGQHQGRPSMFSIKYPTATMFDLRFIPSHSALGAVLDAQEMRQPKGREDPSPFETLEFWSCVVEPLRHNCKKSLSDYKEGGEAGNKTAATHSLPRYYPAAKAYGDLAASLMLHCLDRLLETQPVPDRLGQDVSLSNLNHSDPYGGVDEEYNEEGLNEPNMLSEQRETIAGRGKPLGRRAFQHSYYEEGSEADGIGERLSSDLAVQTFKAEFDAAFDLAVTLSDHYHQKLAGKAAVERMRRSPFAETLALAARGSTTTASLSSYGLPKGVSSTTVKVFNTSKGGLISQSTKRILTTPTGAIVSRGGGIGPSSMGSDLLRANEGHVQQVEANLRAWTVKAVQEGDVFFVSIPLQALSAPILDAVLVKARKHQQDAKKAFLTTPVTVSTSPALKQNAGINTAAIHHSGRQRRWFLLDLHQCIMPRIIALLQRLAFYCDRHGEQHLQMVLTPLPCISKTVQKAHGKQAVINASNIIQVVDFLTQYFGKNVLNGSAGGSYGFGTGAGNADAMSESNYGSGADGGGKAAFVDNGSFTAAANNFSFTSAPRHSSKGHASHRAAPSSPAFDAAGSPSDGELDALIGESTVSRVPFMANRESFGVNPLPPAATSYHHNTVRGPTLANNGSFGGGGYAKSDTHSDRVSPPPEGGTAGGRARAASLMRGQLSTVQVPSLPRKRLL